MAMALLVLLLGPSAPTLSAAGTQEAGDSAGTSAADDSLSVFVSVLPQEYFVDRIAGDLAETTVLVPAGSPPSTYDPTPRQVNAIGGADVWFRIGVPFENSFLPEIRGNVPNLRIVDTRENLELRYFEDHDHDHGEDDHADEDHDHAEDHDHDHGEDDHAEDHDHDHGEDDHDEDHDHDHGEDDHDEDHDHDHDGTADPHVWLGTDEVLAQAATMRDTLMDMDPDNAERYQEGYQDFVADITALEEDLERLLEPLRGESFFVFHPSFGYLLDPYGIEQVAIETGGGEPTPQQLQEIISRGRDADIQVVFVQPEFSQTAAQRVAEALDAEVVEVNPLAPDWLANMRRLAQRIEEGLE
jgi:zinc transport system substrate-binding protein